MSTQPKPDPELAEVFGTEQESEAMVVHGLLESAGIESVVTSVDAPQNIFPGVGGVVVRVNPAQADEARKIIEEYQNAPTVEQVGEDESAEDLEEQG
ncbi:MAG TPA: DUF2007 domain-containing protein [Candidatus Angelobacter sp.]|nr:DUF2007 domain-containing protein [Candidatus Angelobacter sp.]